MAKLNQFDQKSIRRISNAVRRVEGSPSNVCAPGVWRGLPAVGTSTFAATFYYSGSNQWITSANAATDQILPATTCSAKFNRVIYAQWKTGSGDDVMTSLAATQSNYTDAALKVLSPGAYYAYIRVDWAAASDWFEGATPNITNATTTPSGEAYHYDNGYRADSDCEISIYQRINGGAWGLSARCSYSTRLKYIATTGIEPLMSDATLGPLQFGTYTATDVIELQVRGYFTPLSSYPFSVGVAPSVDITLYKLGSQNYAQSL